MIVSKLFSEKSKLIDAYLKDYFARMVVSHNPAVLRLREAMVYSVMNGGKRFRPTLALLVADAFGGSAESVLPFAASVELVHTYSLIHDDLPAMDNDDLRRGQPTNHKVYGEAIALLAGDALLTEAFKLISEQYMADPRLANLLINELAKSAGIQGMVGGQAIDLVLQATNLAISPAVVNELHKLKTGALIRVAILGAAYVCKATSKQLAEICEYGENLGVAFQVADDLLDYTPDAVEPGSFPAVFGYDETKKLLATLTVSAIGALNTWDAKAAPLRLLAEYNCQREK